MSIDELPPTISVEQAGTILGVSRRSAYRAANRGRIPTLRIGRRLLVPTGRLLELLGVGSEEQMKTLRERLGRSDELDDADTVASV